MDRKTDKQPSGCAAKPVKARREGAPDGRKPGRRRDNAKLLMYAAAASAAIAVGSVAYATVAVADAQGELGRVKAETTPAVIAKVAIERGTVISPDMLASVDVPNTYLVADAAADYEAVVGKTALANIPANAQIAPGNLAGEGNATVLAQAVEPGMVAAGVTVDSETGVAGLIRQGDCVDVLAEGSVLVEGARVLALDSEMSEGITQYSTVTLELTVEDAGAIQMAQMDDPVRLILNSEADGKAQTEPGAEVQGNAQG